MYALTGDGPWIDLDEVCSIWPRPEYSLVEIGLKSGVVLEIKARTIDDLKAVARQVVDAVNHRDDPEENPRPRALT